MADYLNIAGRVRTTASDGVAMEAQEVKDLNQNKSQQEINADVQTELGDRYTKQETYSKEQLDELITTPDVNYVSVVATDATTAVTDILPATGEANTIYRVGNWNGTQYDPTMYALYAWNGSAYVCLAVRSFVGEVYDISVNHPDGQGNPTPYADLTAALGTNGANIPQSLQRGGMSVKFVQSIDNKYIRYNLIADEFTTDTTQWAVDDCGVYVDNPEFIVVACDKSKKILVGIRKTDGKVIYGAGVPPQIVEYIQQKIEELSLDKVEDIVSFLNGLEDGDKTLQELLNELLSTKVDKVNGKQLSTNDFTNKEKEIVNSQSLVNNPEYLEVVNDSNRKATEATRKRDGKKVLFGGLDIKGTDFSVIDNPEFLDVECDNKRRIIEATRKKDGAKYISKIDSPTIDEINKRIDGINDVDFIKRVSEQMENASVLGWTPQSDWNNPPSYFPSDNITPLVFLHISDTHGGLKTKEQIEDAVAALNKLSVGVANRGLCAKFMFHTGDIKADLANDNFTYFSDAVTKANVPVFLTPGNHDVGNQSKLVSMTMNNSQIYSQMIAPFIDGWNLKTDGNGTPHPTGKNYYFTDFTDEKIRLISLYEYDTDYELDPNDNTKIKYARGYRSFSQSQLDWFANSLLTTPAGYGVIIAKHAPENKTGNTDIPFNSLYWKGKSAQQTYVDINIIADIVAAFIDGTTINQSYEQTGGIVTTLVADYDFSTKNAGAEFVCYISGHTHCDRISFLADYTNQLELNVGCDNTHYTWGSDMNQRKDALSNDLINVYCVDRNKGVVNIVRIGANISNQMQRRDFCSVNYRVE